MKLSRLLNVSKTEKRAIYASMAQGLVPSSVSPAPGLSNGVSNWYSSLPTSSTKPPAPTPPSRNYDIFIDKPLGRVLIDDQLSADSIVANIMFRAQEVLNERDSNSREAMLKRYQSEIFTALNTLIGDGVSGVESSQYLAFDQHDLQPTLNYPASSKNYRMFSIFSTTVIKRVSPKIRSRQLKFLRHFVFQPVLRFAFSRQRNPLEINELIAAMGGRTFARFRHNLFLDWSIISGPSADRVLMELLEEERLFDAVRFAGEVNFIARQPGKVFGASSTVPALMTPILPDMTVKWFDFLEKIENRKSVEILTLFFAVAPVSVRDAAVQWSIERSKVTGLLKRPWASFRGLGDGRFNLRGSPISKSALSRTQAGDPGLSRWSDHKDTHESAIVLTVPLSSDRIYLVDSAEKLSELFGILQTSSTVGISFQKSLDNDLVDALTLATTNRAYIIDMAVIKTEVFGFLASVLYLVDWLMKSSAVVKLCYSAETLFDQIAALKRYHERKKEAEWWEFDGGGDGDGDGDGDEDHDTKDLPRRSPVQVTRRPQLPPVRAQQRPDSGRFGFANVIDLRGARIRRTLKTRNPIKRAPIDTDERMSSAIDFKDLVSAAQLAGEQSATEFEDVEVFPGFVALPEMTRRFLGFDIDAKLRRSTGWALRPIPKDLVVRAGVEVFALVQLHTELEKRGFKCQEVLGA